jgi:hypothetical protein
MAQFYWFMRRYHETEWDESVDLRADDGALVWDTFNDATNWVAPAYDPLYQKANIPGISATSQGVFIPVTTWRTSNQAAFFRILPDGSAGPNGGKALVVPTLSTLNARWGVQVVEDAAGDHYAIYRDNATDNTTDVLVAGWNGIDSVRWSWTSQALANVGAIANTGGFETTESPTRIALSSDGSVLAVLWDDNKMLGFATSDGALLWNTYLYPLESGYTEIAYQHLQRASDGALYLGTVKPYELGRYDAVLARLNWPTPSQAPTVSWQYEWSPGERYSHLTSMHALNDGGVVAYGATPNVFDVPLLKRFNSAGIEQWSSPVVPGGTFFDNFFGLGLKIGTHVLVSTQAVASTNTKLLRRVSLATGELDEAGTQFPISYHQNTYGLALLGGTEPPDAPEEPVYDPSLVWQFEPLPEMGLSSRYFLGLTKQSVGDLSVSDGNMSLRIESPNELILTQSGMYLPLDAPDDVSATWLIDWPYLSETELERLQQASELGLLTIDDPILASCTGYISNLTYSALPGQATPDGENVYSVRVEFPVTRLEWQPYAAVPPDGSYKLGSGFGATANGQCPLRTPTGIDVADGWFECSKSPLEYLTLTGQSFPPQRGSLVMAFQPRDTWRPGVNTSARTLFAPSLTLGEHASRVQLLGTTLSATMYPAPECTLDLTPLLGVPEDAHYVLGVGYEVNLLPLVNGQHPVAWRVSLGLAALDPCGDSRVVFREYHGTVQLANQLDSGPFRQGALTVAGEYQPNDGSSPDLKVRPLDNRFHLSSYLTRGLLADLASRYLQRYPLECPEVAP